MNPPAQNKIRIRVGNSGTKKDYKCFKWNNKLLKTLMLNNLHSDKGIDFSKVVGPQQYLSNCWFNTAVMCLFISDKGRKFTRHMRENMINGNINPKVTTTKEQHTQLHMILTMFNIVIDNASRGILDTSINTNYIIQTLHNIDKDFSKYFPKHSTSWNPWRFFTQLNEIIASPKLFLVKVTLESPHKIQRKPTWKSELDVLFKQQYTNDTAPDIMALEFYSAKCDINLKGQLLGLKHVAPDGTTINATHTISLNAIKYKLDSAVLRTNDEKHFVSFFTGNDDEYRFDGASIGGIKRFDWKNKLNSAKNFSFHDDFTPSRWKKQELNFTKGYQLLFYYRI